MDNTQDVNKARLQWLAETVAQYPYWVSLQQCMTAWNVKKAKSAQNWLGRWGAGITIAFRAGGYSGHANVDHVGEVIRQLKAEQITRKKQSKAFHERNRKARLRAAYMEAGLKWDGSEWEDPVDPDARPFVHIWRHASEAPPLQKQGPASVWELGQ